MAYPTLGNPISFSQINVELGHSSSASLSLGSAVNQEFGTTIGTEVDISDFYGSPTTSFSMSDDGYSTSALACSQGIPNGTYYHDGAGGLPVAFDVVYTDANGSNTFNGGNLWHYLGFNSIRISTLGIVTDTDNCI